MAKGGLLTNEYRKLHDMVASTSYPLCGVEDESKMHLLRDCVKVQPIWLKFFGDGIWPDFFMGSLTDQLAIGLKVQTQKERCRRRTLLFGYVIC